MDSYHEIDTIKLEKQKAMQRYHTFKKITNIVRTLEILVAISLIFYTISYSISLSSYYFPAIIEFSGVFFRRVSFLIFSPHFVFLLGNAIIITLLAKSKNTNTASDDSGDDEIFREAMENIAVAPAVVPVVEEREFKEKVYRRTKSSADMVVVKAAVEEKKELRRSATEVHRDEVPPAAVLEKRREENSGVEDEEDELSNEEFRKRVEAFIEKHQRSLREEKLAVIVSNN